MSLTSFSAPFSNMGLCVLLGCASRESSLSPLSQFPPHAKASCSTETNMVDVPQFGHDSQFLPIVPTSLVVLHVLVSR